MASAKASGVIMAGVIGGGGMIVSPAGITLTGAWRGTLGVAVCAAAGGVATGRGRDA